MIKAKLREGVDFPSPCRLLLPWCVRWKNTDKSTYHKPIDWTTPREYWQPDAFEGLNEGDDINMFILTSHGVWGVNSLDFDFVEE